MAEGRTILLSSHQLFEVKQTFRAVIVVNKGKTVAEGSVNELMRQQYTGVGCRAELTFINPEMLNSLKKIDGVAEVTSVRDDLVGYWPQETTTRDRTWQGRRMTALRCYSHATERRRPWKKLPISL